MASSFRILNSKHIYNRISSSRNYSHNITNNQYALKIEHPVSEIPVVEYSGLPGDPISRPDLPRLKELRENECLVTAFNYRVIDILEDKRQSNLGTLIVINENQSIKKAVEKMMLFGVGCLFVEDDTNNFKGVLYERTIFRKLAFEELPHYNKVASIMITKPYCVTPGTTIVQCLQCFLDYEVQYLPVRSVEDKIIGVLSIGDIIRSLMDEYHETISILQDYISRTDYKY